MALPSANITVDNVCTELGITRGNNRTVDSLTRHASLNGNSWFRPGSIAPHATTKLVTFTPFSNNDKFDDFRNYDHSALTPHLPDDFSYFYPSGAGVLDITFSINIEQLNIYELSGGSSVYYIFDSYYSSSDRTNQANRKERGSLLVPRSSTTIPTNHTNNQSYKPSTAVHIVQDSIAKAGTTDPDTIYYDIYLANSGGTTVYGRFADSYVDVLIREQKNPYIDKDGLNHSVPGYTPAFCTINAGSSTCAGADITQTQGTQTASFYIHLSGLVSSTWYRLGASSASVRLKITNANPAYGTRYATLNLSSLSSSSNTYETTSNFWGTGYYWRLDDIAQAEILSVSGITQGSSCTP